MSINKILQTHIADLKEITLSDLERFIEKCKNLSIEEALELGVLETQDRALQDPEWSLLSGRLQMEIIHNTTPTKFSDACIKIKDGLDQKYFDFVMNNAKTLDDMIDDSKDFKFDIFAVKTLIKSYLYHIKKNGEQILVERPQYMYMRVASYLYHDDDQSMEKIRLVYNNLSDGYYSHASPTLFNAGTKFPQMGSCFLQHIGDNMPAIRKSWSDQAIISMNSGGLGIDFSSIRHSEIGQRGYSQGTISWIKISNEILKTVDQAGRRKGSATIYMRDCHTDIQEFIELRDEGPEDLRAKELFLAIMVSDLFWKKIEKDENWYLFCPNKTKHLGLFDKYGDEFEEAYAKAVEEKLYNEKHGVIKARVLMERILLMQMKKGMPFILHMDACNKKSNQKHSGVIRCSNLCTEILEVSSEEELASCNLASVSLNSCVKKAGENYYFDFEFLEKMTSEVVENLNHVIDKNFYPKEIPEIERSNKKHRPLGIGVQGMADAIALLDYCWVDENGKISQEIKLLNEQIFETMYYAAIKKSMELAKISGSYPTFQGSPLSQGLFQFDLWGKNPENSLIGMGKWNELREDVKKYGVKNSLLMALMPTASSAHILGNNECFEPFNDLIYTRTVLSGQFLLVNKHLVRDLKELDMWNTDNVKAIMRDGDLRSLVSDKFSERLEMLKRKYLTVYNIDQHVLLELAADRGKYICQTQSMNCFMSSPTSHKLLKYLYDGWKRGLKTGMYYLRQKPPINPLNFALTNFSIDKKPVSRPVMECNDEICIVCQT